MRGYFPKDLLANKIDLSDELCVCVDKEAATELMQILMYKFETGTGFDGVMTGTAYDDSSPNNLMKIQYYITEISGGATYTGLTLSLNSVICIDISYNTQTSPATITINSPVTIPAMSNGVWGEIQNLTFSNDFTSEDAEWIANIVSTLKFAIFTNSVIYKWASKCIDKLKKINTKLDYMLQIPSTRVDGSISFATNITGITTTSGTTMCAYLVGNYLFLFHSMTLSSAAQSSVGTGNFTAKLVGTYTITNFVASSPSADNADNLKKISSATPVGANYEIASNTGYTTGNGQPAAFFWRTSISGTSLKIQLYVKAVKTATSNWQLSVLIPVLRVPPYTG